MSRYIDAEWLKKRIHDVPLASGAVHGCVDKLDLNEAPTIDIVRCKECKYWVSDGGALMICDIHKDPTVPDHFCSYGEREGE